MSHGMHVVVVTHKGDMELEVYYYTYVLLCSNKGSLAGPVCPRSSGASVEGHRYPTVDSGPEPLWLWGSTPPDPILA